MSEHRAQVEWQRQALETFTDDRYSRRHRLRFDGGAEVAGSASPHNVPLPWSDASAVDPEEMFVAALASCHMLWFLSLAARQGWRVERYRDDASGTLARDERGRMAITRVTLRPQVEFGGARLPETPIVAALHDAAHERCFIANSVRCEVVYEAAR